MDNDSMFYNIEAYMKHLVFAHNCLEAYMCLYRNAKQHDNILNKAPGFFTITQYALNKCMILEFAKLFKDASKNNKKERTIYKLINIVRNNKRLFLNINITELCHEIEQKLSSEFSEIIAKLECRRDHDLTHNDHQYFSNERNPTLENYISPQEFEMLYNLAMNFCNKLLNALPVEKTVVLESGADDLNDFINEYCECLKSDIRK